MVAEAKVVEEADAVGDTVAETAAVTKVVVMMVLAVVAGLVGDDCSCGRKAMQAVVVVGSTVVLALKMVVAVASLMVVLLVVVVVVVVAVVVVAGTAVAPAVATKLARISSILQRLTKEGKRRRKSKGEEKRGLTKIKVWKVRGDKIREGNEE